MQGAELFYYTVGVCLILCLTLVFLALSIDTPGYLRARQELLCAEYLGALGFGAVTVVRRGTRWIPLFFGRADKALCELCRVAGLDLNKWRGYRAAVYVCAPVREGAEGCAVLYLYGEQVIGGYVRAASGEKAPLPTIDAPANPR